MNCNILFPHKDKREVKGRRNKNTIIKGLLGKALRLVSDDYELSFGELLIKKMDHSLCDIVKHDLLVMSYKCELRVISCELGAKRYKLKFKITYSNLQVQIN